MTWCYNFYAAWKCRQDWNDRESGSLHSHLFLYLTQGSSCFSYRLINTGFVLPTKNYLTGVVEQMNQGKPNEAVVSGQEVWLWFKHVWWYTGKYAIQMYLQIHLWKISDHMITNALWKYSDLLLCRNSCGVRSGTRRYIHEQDGAQAIQVPNCTTGNCRSHKIKALLMILPYIWAVIPIDRICLGGKAD